MARRISIGRSCDHLLLVFPIILLLVQGTIAAEAPAKAAIHGQGNVLVNPAPSLREVQEKLEKVYRGAVSLVPVREANFMAGDFNGDGSQDLLLIVKPTAGMLNRINAELAPWILEDPEQIWVPQPGKRVQRMPPPPPPVLVHQEDVLLAFIHGHGAKGWRDPLGNQTYLLKNAYGNELKLTSTEQVLKHIRQQNRQSLMKARHFLRYKGALVIENYAGKSRLLYWTGGHYAWLPNFGKNAEGLKVAMRLRDR
jgi:hypothetical protein